MSNKAPLLNSQVGYGGPTACTVAACMIGAALLGKAVDLELIDTELQKACKIWPHSQLLSVPEVLSKLPIALYIQNQVLCFLRHSAPEELGGATLLTALLQWRSETSFCVVTNNYYSFAVGYHKAYFYVVDTHDPSPCVIWSLYPSDICNYIEKNSASNITLLAKQADLYVISLSNS